MLRKIISGGQSGADRVGLDFAIWTGLEHGGFVPQGRKAEDGRIADRYNFLCSNKIEILNVAGPRESKEPGIYEWTFSMLRCFPNRTVPEWIHRNG